jgi:hypothetical protein
MPFSSASCACGWGSRRGSAPLLVLTFFDEALVEVAGSALRLPFVAAFFGGIVRNLDVVKGFVELFCRSA